MRRSLWMLAVALGLIVAWSTGRLQAQGDKVTFADPNHASFAEMPNAGRTGVSSATLWGDPNFRRGWHVHEIRARMGCWLAHPYRRCMDRRH